jgi:hypothetical protein
MGAAPMRGAVVSWLGDWSGERRLGSGREAAASPPIPLLQTWPNATRAALSCIYLHLTTISRKRQQMARAHLPPEIWTDIAYLRAQTAVKLRRPSSASASQRLQGL